MTRPRPLSPHLQVYRLPFTAILSISHRITGVVLSVGLLFTAGIFIVAATSSEGLSLIQTGLVTLTGRIVLWLWVYALCFHACHGVRHLIWDSLHGLDKRSLPLHNLIEVTTSVILTVGAVLLVDGQGLAGHSSP